MKCLLRSFGKFTLVNDNRWIAYHQRTWDKTFVESQRVISDRTPNIQSKYRHWILINDALLIWYLGNHIHNHIPPILEDVTKQDLEELHLTSEINSIFIKFERFPCHTQLVERCVKVVTEGPWKVCGKKNREGIITITINSRKNMPKIETKRDFIPE